MFYTLSMSLSPNIETIQSDGRAASWAKDDELDEVMAVTESLGMFAAVRFRAIERMRRASLALEPEGHEDMAYRSVRLELAAALRVTEHTADGMLGMAFALVNDYPEALIALAEGRITEQHARVLVDSLAELPDEEAAALAPRVLELAESQPVGVFRRAVKKFLDAARSESLAARHERALAERYVAVSAASDGMAWLTALLPQVEANAIYNRLSKISKHLGEVPGEERTREQLRADVLADLLIEGNTSDHPEQAHGIRASVVVTVPALSLLDESSANNGGFATVEGVGPIPIDRARELCGGASDWMRVLTHPETGVVLSVGRDLYRPPASLRRLVQWRSERCMAPGCSIPASRCEIDHNVAWEHGGATELQNLTPFCKGHHTVKHHTNWRVRQLPDSGGVIEWTSPTGRQYLVEPERRVPVFRPASDTATQVPAPF
jgi:hypothetical protein